MQMLSSDFEKYFDKNIFNDSFLGVFSSDNYPKSIKPHEFFILNKDKSYEPGSHWIACYFNGESVELFDSLGTSGEYVNNLLQFSKNLICYFNESQLQPLTSDACGQFCIYFLYKRYLSRELSFKYFLNLNFSSDLPKNDVKVRTFCSSVL